MLSRLILAQRPSNHEAWTSLGRMHERRREYSDAWLCYDQAQSFFPVNRQGRIQIPHGERDRWIEKDSLESTRNKSKN